MKITCMKQDLLQGINTVLKAVPAKTTMTILECIVIDASADRIKLISNDMEMGIETYVNGEIAEHSSIALNAKMLSEIIRRLPDSSITITTDSAYKATITCGKATFSINGRSCEEFPVLPTVQRDKFITLFCDIP